MRVIEAQRASILVPGDYGHINQPGEMDGIGPIDPNPEANTQTVTGL